MLLTLQVAATEQTLWQDPPNPQGWAACTRPIEPYHRELPGSVPASPDFTGPDFVCGVRSLRGLVSLTVCCGISTVL